MYALGSIYLVPLLIVDELWSAESPIAMIRIATFHIPQLSVHLCQMQQLNFDLDFLAAVNFAPCPAWHNKAYQKGLDCQQACHDENVEILVR